MGDGLCVAVGVAQVQILQSRAAEQRGVIPDTGPVQLQEYQLLAVADGADVQNGAVGQDQVFQMGHIADELDIVDAHVTQVDADHVLAVAQIVGIRIVEVVHTVLHGHEVGIIGADGELAALDGPDQLVLLAYPVPGGGQRFVVQPAVADDDLLQIREVLQIPLQLLSTGQGDPGEIQLGIAAGHGLTHHLLLTGHSELGHGFGEPQHSLG